MASTREERLFVAGGKVNWSNCSAKPWSPPNPPVPDSNSQGNHPRGSHALVGQEVHTAYPRSRTDQEWNVHWMKYHATVRMNQLQRSTPMWALSGRGRTSRKTHSLVPGIRTPDTGTAQRDGSRSFIRNPWDQAVLQCRIF